MGQTALLVPRAEMLQQAHNVLQGMDFNIDYMKVIRTEDAVMEARHIISDGCSIILARGLQAALIRQYTDATVVDIVVPAQEMAALINQAKNIARKPHPVIAVVGHQNMFSDMSSYAELFDVELREYYPQHGDAEGIRNMAILACEEAVDVIIGGEIAVQTATEWGILSLFLTASEAALRDAIVTARLMNEAISARKRSTAEMEALLDFSFNGVIWMDKKGIITSMNPMMEQILNVGQDSFIGKPVDVLSPEITRGVMEQVLEKGKKYSLCIPWNGNTVFATFTPVVLENKIDGAVLSCNKMQKIAVPQEPDNASLRKNDRNAGVNLARRQFHDVLQRSPKMQECVRVARLYAYSDQPVVLIGESGTEKRILAECIHNGSRRAGRQFLDVPCEGLNTEEQKKLIFEDRGAFMQCPGGTVMIRSADFLTSANQYRLYQAIYFHVIHKTETAQLQEIDVRVIVTLTKPLRTLWQEGRLQDDLYYLLSGLELSVPPLREREEDLSDEIDLCLAQCNERYNRYHVLTAEARQLLLKQRWPGNIFQIESFCDRLILTAVHRSIDEIAVKSLLLELYPDMELVGTDEALSSYESDADAVMNDYVAEARRIRRALHDNGGSREKTAAQLGISKATLWRKMKKLGVRE